MNSGAISKRASLLVGALAATAGLPRDALHSQLASGLHLVVHLARAPGGPRRVGEVAVLERTGDHVTAAAGWVWDGQASAGLPGPRAAALDRLLAGPGR